MAWNNNMNDMMKYYVQIQNNSSMTETREYQDIVGKAKRLEKVFAQLHEN